MRQSRSQLVGLWLDEQEEEEVDEQEEEEVDEQEEEEVDEQEEEEVDEQEEEEVDEQEEEDCVLHLTFTHNHLSTHYIGDITSEIEKRVRGSKGLRSISLYVSLYLRYLLQ